VKNEITPRILDMEKEHVFPWEIINKAWKTGLINLSIPESVRGYEMDLFTSALVVEGLSYGDTGISTSAMCNDLANVVIGLHGTDEQKNLFLKPFVEKPILASFCLTEPNAGSDNSMMAAFISKREDGKYILNGAKCFFTNASYASQFTVLCKTGKPTGNLWPASLCRWNTSPHTISPISATQPVKSAFPPAVKSSSVNPRISSDNGFPTPPA
jgi:acyl-CoA dehydrogenase